MKTISKRELNQQTARVLAGVREDAPVLVTERGVPRWRIEATTGETDPIARLTVQGRITPRKAKPPAWPKDWKRRGRGRTPAEVDALLAEMRGDR